MTLSEELRYPVTWVDAFTDRPFAGNPAAVCLSEQPLAEAFMQSLAFEFGISETAFVSPMPGHMDEFALRWFTPTTEVDLCGHATLASAHVLREQLVVDGTGEIGFHTRSGRLSTIFDGSWIELDLPRADAAPTDTPTALSFIDPERIVHCRKGEFFFLVEVTDAELVRTLVPDLDAIARLPTQALLVTAAGDEPGLDYVQRVFGPNVGIDEDPVTGAAACVAGPYWSEKLARPQLLARQVSARTGEQRVRVGDDRVKVAGQAVSVMHGEVPGHG